MSLHFDPRWARGAAQHAFWWKALMSIRRSGATVILTYYAKQVGPTPSEPRVVWSFKFPSRFFALYGETMNEFIYRVEERWGFSRFIGFSELGWGFTLNHPLKVGFFISFFFGINQLASVRTVPGAQELAVFSFRISASNRELKSYTPWVSFRTSWQNHANCKTSFNVLWVRDFGKWLYMLLWECYKSDMNCVS